MVALVDKAAAFVALVDAALALVSAALVLRPTFVSAVLALAKKVLLAVALPAAFLPEG